MTRTLQLAAAIILLFGSSPAVLGQGPATTAPLTATERAALNPRRATLEHGWDVANAACSQCHGLDGLSTGPGIPHLAGQRLVYLYRVLLEYQDRERHNDAMNHAIGFLNQDALLAVAAYYANLAPAPVQLSSVEEDESAKEKGRDPFVTIRDTLQKCIKCHGEHGNSSASGMPNLTAQDPAYFVQAMQAYRSGARSHRLMEKLVADLDDDTLLKLGTYYAVQEPARTETTGDGNADMGQAISEPCANCHGADGNPTGANMPTLAGQDARYFGKAMEAYKGGKRSHEQMFEAAKNLSEEDIANLAAFFASQEPVRRNVRTPLTTAEWITRCERCHGFDGNSTDPRFPMLAGQERTYLMSAMRAYADATRANSAMHAMAAPLSGTDLDTIVEYYATSVPKAVVYVELPCEDGSNQ